MALLGKKGSAGRTYRLLHRRWPLAARRGTAWLMGAELVGLVPILVIFGISQPDLYRTDMWQIGFDNQLNSNPNMILYAYANYRPLPTIPLVWSRTLTNFNVAISVISLFFLLAKLIAFIMKLWYPICATFVNVAIAILYCVSVYGQIGPDYADKRYPSPAAWYFRKGCDLAKPYGQYKSCQIAQGSLAVTLYMLVVYLINLGFAVWAMWPNPTNDVDSDDDDDDEYAERNYGDHISTIPEANVSSHWEMQNIKSQMNMTTSPFTPRTTAFKTLDRELPLRQPQSTRFG